VITKSRPHSDNPEFALPDNANDRSRAFDRTLRLTLRLRAATNALHYGNSL
jgi:hypothetical protein